MFSVAMQQAIINQGANWTDVISALSAIAAVVISLVVFFLKRNKNKK